MSKFTFVHAADLHLGAPFRGLDAAASGTFGMQPGKGNLLVEAGFNALDRLEAVCLETGAAFLLLAGDIYDDAYGVLRARFALRDMFMRLGKAGVRVFIAHGNHDPLSTGPLPVSWPDNVTVFGPEPLSVCVAQGENILALVQGISHTIPREKANLATRFRRYTPDEDKSGPLANLPDNLAADIFQIAVLHCNVGGSGEGHMPYAPCTLSDLTGAGFDYWALGHVHQGKRLSTTPHVVYPGSAQGLHINETETHGCVVAQVDGKNCVLREVPLAPVLWRKVHIDVATDSDNENEPESIDELADRILARLETEAGSCQAATEALFCRILLAGATNLDTALRKPGSVATLLERLRREIAVEGTTPGTAHVWIKDIVIATRPLRDFSLLAERNDLVGEVVRLADATGEDSILAKNLASSLAPLYEHHKVKKALDTAALPDIAELAGSAKSLLCSLLEED